MFLKIPLSTIFVVSFFFISFVLFSSWYFIAPNLLVINRMIFQYNILWILATFLIDFLLIFLVTYMKESKITTPAIPFYFCMKGGIKNIKKKIENIFFKIIIILKGPIKYIGQAQVCLMLWHEFSFVCLASKIDRYQDIVPKPHKYDTLLLLPHEIKICGDFFSNN